MSGNTHLQQLLLGQAVCCEGSVLPLIQLSPALPQLLGLLNGGPGYSHTEPAGW